MAAAAPTNLLPPGSVDRERAAEAVDALRGLAAHRGESVRVADDEGHVLVIPREVLPLLSEFFALLSAGRGVHLVPQDKDLSPEQAAQILNVSRKYVTEKLIKTGKLPVRMVGSHHRIDINDLMAFKRQDDLERRAAMNELIALEDELGLRD